MKARELRIGNLVMDGQEIEQVNARMIDMLVKIEADFDPIPLTEEWLLKFGFNKEPDKSFTKRDIAIFLDKRFIWLFVKSKLQQPLFG